MVSELERMDEMEQKLRQEKEQQPAAPPAAVSATEHAEPVRMPKPGKKVQMAVEPEEAEAPDGVQLMFGDKGKLRRMDTPAAGVLMYARSQMRSRIHASAGSLFLSQRGLTRAFRPRRSVLAGDDESPQKPAGDGPPEGKPLDKIIRSELTEGDEEEGGGGGGGLSLELPDDAGSSDGDATPLDRMDTPSTGLLHNNSLNKTDANSPVQGTVGKVHAVTGELATT